MTLLREIEPDRLCARCDHRSCDHAPPAQGSECRIVEGRAWRGVKMPGSIRAKKCWCDSFWPAPR